jgi:peptidoglycan/LPS O-acetylase OafA/YrhL
MVTTTGSMAAPPAEASAPAKNRLAGLDGIRGLAALFVVLHHSYLMSFPGYPAITGPGWAGWMIYGHIAVVVFIVLSGFSLAVSPARHEWRLGGKTRFAIRRAWRILPPYWAALAFSLIVAWTLVPQPGEAEPTGKSVAVFGLLLQDIFGSPSPNGAFWSIAVEAQLYVVFPLLLLMLRKAHSLLMLASVTAVVAAVGLLLPYVSLVDMLQRLTPQLAALFAVGVFAAGILPASNHVRRLPWHWLSLAAFVPVLAVIVIQGSVWTIGNYFWIDLALGPAIAMLLAAAATERPRWLVGFLNTRPMRSLGSFSYSLYLIHAPIVVAIYELVVAPHVAHGVPALLVMLAIAVPVSVVAARLFAAVFEIPFQRHRSWSALKAAVRPAAGSAVPGGSRRVEGAQNT